MLNTKSKLFIFAIFFPGMPSVGGAKAAPDDYYLSDDDYSSDDYYRSFNFKRTYFYPQFFQKTNKSIRLHYYNTSGRIVFVRFLEEFEDTKKTFRN